MTGRLSGLDALRGVAALQVVIYHALGGDGRFPGYLAVDFFFMLSGYIMARTYEARFSADLTPLPFLKLRFRRLWPMMAFGTSLGLVFMLLAQADYPAPWLAMLCGLLFLPLSLTPDIYPLNGPTWSIFFELFANLVHAARLHRVTTRRLLQFGLGMLFATVALSYGMGRISGGIHPKPFLVCFFRVLAPYAIGIVLYRVLQDKALLRTSPVMLYAALPLAMAAGMVVHPLLFGLLFVGVICPTLIVLGLSTESRLGSFLGAASFPLYAIHAPILAFAEHYAGNAALGGLIAVGAAAVLTLGIEAWRSAGRRGAGSAALPVPASQ